MMHFRLFNCGSKHWGGAINAKCGSKVDKTWTPKNTKVRANVVFPIDFVVAVLIRFPSGLERLRRLSNLMLERRTFALVLQTAPNDL